MPVTAAAAVPHLLCPTATSSLITEGLAPVCAVASGVASGVTDVAGSAASQVAGFGVDTVLDALGSWVSAGATWLLTQIGGVLGSTTSIDLTASWFTSHYRTMAALAGVVILPLLLLGIVQSLYRQDASSLVRSVVVNVPLAVLLTAVAVKLVELGLSVTDAMSASVAKGAGLDAGHFMGTVTVSLSGAAAAGQPTVPAFILFLGSLAVVFGAVLVWVELLIRSAAVYVTVLFLPLALASLAWPTISHWCRRLVDTLVALILGKFVIVSVLSLAAGSLAGAGGAGGGFSAVLGGAALLILSAFVPWALFRLLPFLEAGAVGHLEGLSQRARHTMSAPGRSLAQTAMQAASSGAVTAAGRQLVGGAAGGGLTGGSLLGPSLGGGQSASSNGGSGRPCGAGGGVSSDTDASSAESTGVGTVQPPGSSIPVKPIHPEATATAHRLMAEWEEESKLSGAGTGTGVGAATSSGREAGDGAPTLKPLPRQSGMRRAEALGRDELGIRLIGSHPRPALPPASGGSSGPGSDGRADG